MMFRSFNSNTTGITSGAGTFYSSEAAPVLSGDHVTLVFYVVFCTSMFVLLSFFVWPLNYMYFDLRLSDSMLTSQIP